jgi:hypothetical protein
MLPIHSFEQVSPIFTLILCVLMLPKAQEYLFKDSSLLIRYYLSKILQGIIN